MNCKRCGGAVVPSSRFCEDCGAPVDAGQEASGDGNPVDVAVPAPRRATTVTAAPSGTAAPSVTAAADGPAVLPGSPIRLGDGEVVWRQYRAVRLRNRRRGQGTLYVTDARVVFYAWARGRGAQRGSALVQQVKLEDVSGFRADVTRRLSTILLLLATGFTLFTLVTLLIRSLPLAVLFAILAAVCIAALFTDAAQRGSAGVTIHSREADAGPVRFGGIGVRHPLLDVFLSVMFFPLQMLLRSYTVTDVLRGRPGDDSDLVIAELGALIMDLQTRGTLAAAHYEVQHGEDPLQVRGVS